MASLFRLAGSQSHGTGYHTPSHPDYASFDLPSDDEDDDQTPATSHNTPYAHRVHSSGDMRPFSVAGDSVHPLAGPSTAAGGAHDASASSPPLATTSGSRSASPPSFPGSLPGYDFEPQSDPAPPAPSGAPPSIPSSTRPSLSASVSRSTYSSRAPRAPAGYQQGEEDAYGRSGAAGGGAAGLLRGLVGRLRGHQSSPSHSGWSGGESSGLLFSQEGDSDETDTEGRAPPSSSSYPPRQPGVPQRDIHLPLPARAPQFGAPLSASSPNPAAAAGGRIFGGGQGNDGVFANLAAKPDNANGMDVVGEGPDKDEVLPSYDSAALDTTPPYWETTVLTPGSNWGPDDVIIDGLPVGNFFSFAWGLLVSSSFQFVGFLLTYLLHTTHAAKNGSRAGLGITLIQLGFYLKQRTDGLDPSSGDATGLNGAPGPGPDTQRWSWWGGSYPEDGTAPTATSTATALGALPTQLGAALSGALEASDPAAQGMPSLMGDPGLATEEEMMMSYQANEWFAFAMVTVGSFLLIGSCLSYWRAVRWARALRQGQGPRADQEAAVA
ncbi:hypothetical protein JCM10213_009302 [Rhodosporidiobolus nylandii]